jgi:uncharacterized protein YdaU (DUF1376 family)
MPKRTPRIDRFLPLDLNDFLMKDASLTAEEHIFCLRLLVHYWRTGLPIPDDPGAFSRISGSSSGWKDHEKAILAHWERRNGGWVPKLYAADRAEAERSTEERRRNGRLGGRKSAATRSKPHKPFASPEGEANGSPLLNTVTPTGTAPTRNEEAEAPDVLAAADKQVGPRRGLA